MADFECPYCGEEIDIHDYELFDLVTYHGEEPAQNVECLCCEKEFWVKEEVRRDFTTGKTEEEANSW